MPQRVRIRRTTRRTGPSVRRASAGPAVALRSAAAREQAGGGLTIGGARDPAEKAADRAADRVMRLARPEPVVKRECSACAEDGEERQVRAKSAPGSAPVAPGAAAAPASAGQSKAIGALGGGRPLASAERAFFEPRFGADLSPVRVHDGAVADRASKAIDARAFSLGNDIAFAHGEYSPGTDDGRRLMAHELAHVMQNGSEARGKIGRKPAIQKADHPTQAEFKAVPDKDEPRLMAALAIIEQVSKNAKCKAFFKSNCSGGKKDELQQAIDNSKIYKRVVSGLRFGGMVSRDKTTDPRDIAYTPYVFRVGRWQLAASLLHEMFHTCIIGKIADEEAVDEKGIQECGFFTPWIHRVNPPSGRVGEEINVKAHRVGSGPDATHKLLLGRMSITAFTLWKHAGAGLNVNFKVPAGATSGDLFFENNGIKSNAVKFTVTP
jgi:hypothetical protein